MLYIYLMYIYDNELTKTLVATWIKTSIYEYIIKNETKIKFYFSFSFSLSIYNMQETFP